MSRRHACVDVGTDKTTIADLESSNGTFVAGERITEPRILADGDVIELGAATLTFRAWSDERAARTERVVRAPRDSVTGTGYRADRVPGTGNRESGVGSRRESGSRESGVGAESGSAPSARRLAVRRPSAVVRSRRPCVDGQVEPRPWAVGPGPSRFGVRRSAFGVFHVCQTRATRCVCETGSVFRLKSQVSGHLSPEPEPETSRPETSITDGPD